MLTLMISLLAQDPVWPGIEVDGWTYLSDTRDHSYVIFVRPPTENRIWVRVEYRGERALMSERQLIEADCNQGRTRTLQREGFL